MGGRHAPLERSGVGLTVLGVGFSTVYWVAQSAMHAFVFQRGSFLEQCLPRDASEITGRLVAVVLLLSMGLIGGMRRQGRPRGASLSPQAATGVVQHWSDSAVRTVRETEERYRALVENIDIGISLIDKEYNILMTNEAQGSFFHKPTCEFVGKKCHREFEKRAETCPHCPGAVAMRTGRPAEVETFGTRDDGSRFPVRIRAFPMKAPDGTITSFIEVVQDIADRKQAEAALRESEERFRTLCQFAPVGIFVTDRTGDCTYANNRLQEIAGLSLDESLGMQWTRLLHPDDREETLAAVAETIQSGSEFSREFRIVTPAGETKQLAVRATWLRATEGGPLGQVGVIEDVSERRRADEALRKSEAKHRTLVEQLPAIIYTAALDAASTTTYVSPQVERILGFSPSDYRTDPDMWRQGVHPEDRGRVLRELARSHAEHRPFVCEYRMTAADGRVVWFRDSAEAVRDENGRPMFLQGVMLDITDRKRAEEELRKFKTICDRTPHGLAVIDLKGRCLYLNDAWASMHGYTREELLGQHVSAFHAPEQMPLVERLNEGLASRGSYVNEEVWHKRRDGTVFPTLMDAVVINDDQGRPLFLSGMAVDITERKETEAVLRRQALVFENINDGVIITDQAGIITDWNPGAERIFDYFKHEIIGKTPELLNRPEEAEPITESIQAGMQSDGYWSGEVNFVRKDGSEGICEAFLVPVRNEKGDWVGTVAVNRDITARKIAEEEKAHLTAQLHQAQKMDAVGTLASGIAHDFNNLLTAIFGYAGLARDSLPAEHTARRSLAMIEQAGKQARGVINALLTFGHKAVPRKSPLDLVQSLTETRQFLHRLLPAAIEIEVNLPAEADVWVNGDASQLQQVWINLAVNARDAMPEGGRLQITLSKEEARGAASAPSALVVVEDSGVGMSAETRSRAFEPFFTTRPRGQGAGLGLAVSHAIIAQHEGTISIDSEEGAGTRVMVSLPCCPRPADEPAAPADESAGDAQGGTIVVVEDDEHVRAILVSALRSQGYDVHFAANGEEAMDVYSRPDLGIQLVVLDLDIPKASGASILRRTLDALPRALVLVVTGRIDWHPDADADGRQFVLRKPFTIQEMSVQVARLVRQLRKQQTGPESA